MTRRLPLIFLLTLLGGGLAAVWSLVVTPRFEATTRFAPGDLGVSQLPGGLASLASQFGAGGPMGGPRSLQFYADVLESRDLLTRLLEDEFTGPADSTRATLLELLPVGGESSEQLEDGLELLREQVLVTTVDDRTGTVSLTVVMPSARLAADVANRLYQHFEAFNIEMRRTSASERRRFADRELATARADLQSAEGAMRDFLESNRGGLEAPRLTFQQYRLQRRIDVAQQVYSQMAQELTEAKIAEARDTPVFAVVQRAHAPARRSWPNRTRTTLMGALAGGAFGVLLAALLGTTGFARAIDPVGYDRFRAALRGRQVTPHNS